MAERIWLARAVARKTVEVAVRDEPCRRGCQLQRGLEGYEVTVYITRSTGFHGVKGTSTTCVHRSRVMIAVVPILWHVVTSQCCKN